MWNEGYVADIDYTYGYYSELNPLRLRFSLIAAGIKPPEIKNACELGFGQGLSLVAHAASFDFKWHGNDFNPSQAAFASEISKGLEPTVGISDEDFATFCMRDDLPNFDFISLHGIWSWISAKNQNVIVEFIKRKLNFGGAVYISYNVPLGWSSMLPMRDLLVAFTQQNVPNGSPLPEKINSALDFAGRLMAVEPAFASANPSLAKRLELMRKQDAKYLAHEYFNADWSPIDFMSFHSKLTEAKLSFAVSANVLDSVPVINFTDEQHQLINEIDDPIFRETIKDFIVNQTFRRDFWVKGARKLAPHEKISALKELDFTLVSRIENISLEVQGMRGTANLNSELYDTVLRALEKLQRFTFRDLQLELRGKITLDQMIEALTILVGKGDVAPSTPAQISKDRKKYSDQVNTKLVDAAVGAEGVDYLLSPVLGGALKVPRLEKLMLRALKQEVKGVENITNYVWSILGPQGHKLRKEGRVLESDAENLSEINSLVETFLDTRLKTLKRLEIFS